MKLNLKPACPNHFISTFPLSTSYFNGIAWIFASISFAALIAAIYYGDIYCGPPGPPGPGAVAGTPAPDVGAPSLLFS